MSSLLTTALPYHTLHISGQPIWLFDLHLSSTERSQRRTELDKVLRGFFSETIAQPTANATHVWQNFDQLIDIIHTQGQPAQVVFLSKSGNLIKLPLAISYALPFSAVAICCKKTGSHTIGLDMCGDADFEVMSSAEKQQFCQDYFANMPSTEDSSILARRWSVLEATLKHLQMPLSQLQDNPYFFDYLPPLSVSSEKVYLDGKKFWVSMVMD